MRGLVWFREDLRTQDNTALSRAAKHCAKGIVGVYYLDVGMWRKHNVAGCRVDFTLRGLELLRADLHKLNIPLLILEIDDTKNLPHALIQLMLTVQADALYFNRQYEVNEKRRDQAVSAYLKENNKEVFSFDDQIILPPNSVKNLQGDYYKVYTPYKRAWQKQFLESNIRICPTPKMQTPLAITIKPTVIPKAIAGFDSLVDPKIWPAGERVANIRLQKFIEKGLFAYAENRDFPARDGTSKLSPYLATGMISPRQCFLAALDANNQELDTSNRGAVTWMSELIWREFYKHILSAVPRVSMHQAYKIQTDHIQWAYDEKFLQAWQEGKTGFPIIDAAMRQLNQLGWMHNRLRMVVAMFLTKNLFFDWRLGEKYFMSHLIDGDLSANNGGWQWSASTGTDAAPYFRIFNPIRQSERFDPNGDFIRQYCPELRDLSNKKIHQPIAPIIDLNANRLKVMTAFKNIG